MSSNDIKTPFSRGIEICDMLEIPNSHRPWLRVEQLEPGIGGVCHEFTGIIAIDTAQLSNLDEFDAIYLHELAHHLLPPRLYHAWPFLAISALIRDRYMRAREIEPEPYFERAVFYDLQWWWASPASMKRGHIRKAKEYAQKLADKSLVAAAKEIARNVPAFHFYSLFTCRRPRPALIRMAMVGVVGWWLVASGGWGNYSWIFN